MNYTVYVLRSVTHNKTYVGLTSDLKRRLAEHNAGRSRSTKPYKLWKLVHHEEFESRDEARKREKYLKSGSGRELLRKIFSFYGLFNLFSEANKKKKTAISDCVLYYRTGITKDLS